MDNTPQGDFANMTHSNIWSITTPTDEEQAGEGAAELRKEKVDIKERLAVDHCMNGIIDTSQVGADGQHRKATFVVQPTDPDALTGAIIIYAKADGLYFRSATAIGRLS